MEVHNYLSTAKELVDQNKLLDAEKILKKGLESNSDFYLYHVEIGEIYTKLHKFDEAEKHYNKAFLLNPDASWIHKKVKKLNERNASQFVGIYETYPDCTGKRQLEGGRRIKGEKRKSKSGEPLVTIVTVVFNNEDTLQRCIDSVKNQQYSNIEYIVIDGGSNQKTLDIIKSNEDVIDYFVSEPDDGIYAAMNKGIRLASGDFICLLNSDDFYDNSFVKLSVERVNKNSSLDIVYTDYYAGQNHLVAQPLSEGILFGHLHVCHNTFLASKQAYNIVGPYREDYRIVSDAIWMRKAFLKGLTFECIDTPLFTLSEGGLSSGGTEEHRRLFIREVAESYRINFPELTIQDAESIYLFRFNKLRSKELIGLIDKYSDNSTIINALRLYVEHCFKDRANFKINRAESESVFPLYLELVDKLGVKIRNVQLETKNGSLQSLFDSFDEVIRKKRVSSEKTILHFISVFSAPSETFVYNLLNGLDETGTDNFVLYEHERLSAERPFNKKIRIFWNDYPEVLAKRLYKYIVDSVKPDVVIAHFALNEWKWAQRIHGLGIDIPTISMCHGIDAFSMRNNNDYRNYLVEEFSKRDNTQFTAVSKYLKNELVSNGVPGEKIALVPNSVTEKFFKNRKCSNFYDGKRQLNIVAVGRLIPLKGHEHLLDALKIFKEQTGKNFDLTIVYGNGDNCLIALQQQAESLGIGDNVSFVPFVDFDKQPGYLSQFDLFIHPSVYSNDVYNRSETFGIAVLEAIAAGLPVITTNAGGLPEVIGDEKIYARVVEHSNPQAITEAMMDMLRSSKSFTDNRTFSERKIEEFSQERQIEKLKFLINKVTKKQIKAALFSTSTIQGAGYAAYRLHRGLRSTNIKSHLYTTVRNHEDQPDVTVLKHPSGDNRQWNALQLKPKEGLTISTINHPHISSKDLIEMVEPYDIINVHWHARFLSVENIATLTHLDKPVVMTIRDMMPITGGCHFFHGCEKWKDDCSNCPQINSVHTDFPSRVLKAKRENYNFDNLTLVALSNHTKRILEQTPYFSQCRIEVINNSIETDVFKPHDRIKCREEFGLPKDRKIIGYVPSFSSEVKGYREFLKAMEIVKNEMGEEDPFVMLVGNETPATREIKQDKKALGYISDNNVLARAYCAADLVVVPSLEETFSNTTAESISCAVPVVGFKTGAIPDLAIEGTSGITCEVGDYEKLASNIISTLRGDVNFNSARCRDFALEELQFHIQAQKYETLFTDLVSVSGTKSIKPKNIESYSFFSKESIHGLLGVAIEKLIQLNK